LRGKDKGSGTGEGLTRPDIDFGKESSGGKDSGGIQQGGKTMQVTKPNDPERDACHDACDTECEKKINNCVTKCETKYEEVCEEASKTLIACNIACMHVPMAPGPGPSARMDCFNGCVDIFDKACSNQGMQNCLDDCPSNYQVCEKNCYSDC